MTHDSVSIIAFIRKHYIPEGGSKYQYCEIPYPSEITPFMYIYIYQGDSEIREQNFREQNFREQTI